MNFYFYKIYQFVKFKSIGYPISPNQIFKFLMKSQYWTREVMRNFQLEKLNDLIKFTNKSSRYYSKIYENKELTLSKLNELPSKIPLTTKKEIIENYPETRTENFTKKYKHATSGSTGEPLITYISGYAEAYREACRMRFRSWWGIQEYDRNVYIGKAYSNNDGSLFFKIKRYIRGRLDIDIFHLNDNSIVKYYNQIEKFKPVFIRGYKSGILEFAELMDKNNLKFKNFKLKVTIVTAETLFENERRYIEKILNSKVANEYGAVEAGLFACECPVGSMHINEESVYMYTNNQNEVIVTELFNDSIPLVNYKNDDLIIISDDPCSCGITSRIIKEVQGRVSGYIVKPDGSRINQIIIPIIFRKFYENKFKRMIRKYKVIQEAQTFTIKIIPLDNYNKECEEHIRTRMFKEIGHDIIVNFEIVNEIKRGKNGKFTFFERFN